MNKILIKAQELHQIEISLNQINFRGLEIGSAWSFYFDRLYRGDFDNRFFRNIIYLGYYFFKARRKKKYIKDYNKNFIYFKTGMHGHHQAMADAVIYDKGIKQNTFIIGANDSELSNRKIFYAFRFSDLFKIIVFVVVKMGKISALLKPLQMSLRTTSALYFYLVLQLLKAQSFNRFLKYQQTVKLIGADYDRGSDTSLLFICAKALKIKNFTLQHGVINPPVGYSPINASEIWVWSEMSRLQLIELGVAAYQIKKTGTPIVSELRNRTDLRDAVLKKYNLKMGRTVVLALSSPNKTNDIKLVEFFARIKDEFGASTDNFLVKIHPARTFSKYSWIINNFKIHLLPQDIPHEDFMTVADVLLAHTSGIATEALYYGKKVGILDILDESPGNGLELNKYFRVPLIRATKEFSDLIEFEESIIDRDMAFYKIGDNAKQEIAKRIKGLILYKLQ